MRDTRRSVGLGGFRLASGDLSADIPSHGTVEACPTRHLPQGNPFPAEAVALGDYLYFDVHRLGLGVCAGGGGKDGQDDDDDDDVYPTFPTLAPYFVPFRALTSADVPNLLVAGKTMAQTFAANAATRFHPVEWATGAAAGAATAQFIVGASSSSNSTGNHGDGSAVVSSTAELYETPWRLGELRSAIEKRHAPLNWRACPEEEKKGLQ